MHGVFIHVIKISVHGQDHHHYRDCCDRRQQKERPSGRLSMIVADVHNVTGVLNMTGWLTVFCMLAHAFLNANPSSKRMSPTGTSACCLRRHQNRNDMVLPTATNAAKSIQWRLT